MAAAPVPALPERVTVRVGLTPSGATAMRLDHGQTVIVGTTPVDMLLDCGATSELILDLDGYAPQTVHVDPVANRTSRSR